MIRRFKCRETSFIWEGKISKRFPRDIQDTARRKLRMINQSRDLKDLLIPPGNRLEQLKGSRKGQYSIRINDQWRICFKWNEGDAYDVEVVDYH